METKRRWTERFDAWALMNPFIWVVRRVAVILSVLTIIGTAVYFGYREYNGHFRWREGEYEKLAALHSDFTLARFEEKLGAPTYERSSEDGKWTEYLFHGRDYWVQAISKTGSETVGFYAVTACSPEFKPEFRLPGGDAVTFHRSTLASLRRNAFWYRYEVGISTRPTFIELTGGSHALNFKYFGWGFSAACRENEPDFFVGVLGPYLGGKTGGIGELPKQIRKLGQTLTVNTFAEWGPTEGDIISGGWPEHMSVGIDQILIGAAENESA